MHITRAGDWTDSESTPIPREEWLDIVGKDRELGPDPENGQDDFLYLTHPQEPAPLWWARGRVYTKDPDCHTIRKMIELATRLAAQVQGDDGHFYTDWERYEEIRSSAWPNRARKSSLWSRLFGR